MKTGENARNWRLDRSIWEGKSTKTLLEAYALIDFPEFHTTEVSEIAKNENDKWIKINSEMHFRRLLYNTPLSIYSFPDFSAM